MSAQLMQENERRHALARRWDYDPLKGDPSAQAGRVAWTAPDGETLHVPPSMLADPDYAVASGAGELEALRMKHDFEYWAAKCVSITHKETKRTVPFVLNRPQRRLLAAVEAQRLAGEPIRLIMLKARQWGGSTFVQVYMAWIQLLHRTSWHSLICSHVKDVSAGIRGMYTQLLADYPEPYWPGGEKPRLAGCEGMANTRTVPSRGCRITVCSAESQDSMRGLDCSMAHLTEVAFWRDSLRHNPVDLIRSVLSGIPRVPLSVVVMESTANGVGNFFHTEWKRAVDGKGDKTPFFVPWHEIDAYTLPGADGEAFLASLDGYEQWLWREQGCTLEAIAWYRAKRREYADHTSMMAEFPTTPAEAFATTDRAVFAEADVEALGKLGKAPGPERGEVAADTPYTFAGARFVPSRLGLASVWVHPRPGAAYIVSVDIGGRSRQADYSVITVLDPRGGTPDTGRLPQVVAQWRGHIDHDLLAWKAAAMAAYYNTALLVVESNTWETGSEGRGQYILRMLDECYPNMYRRRSGESAPGAGDGAGAWLPGFHTNTRTKPALIAHLIALVREGGYLEPDAGTLGELLQYECRPDGSYGARRGAHDDLLMSRAIALWICHTEAGGASAQPLSGPERRALLAQRW